MYVYSIPFSIDVSRFRSGQLYPEGDSILMTRQYSLPNTSTVSTMTALRATVTTATASRADEYQQYSFQQRARIFIILNTDNHAHENNGNSGVVDKFAQTTETNGNHGVTYTLLGIRSSSFGVEDSGNRGVNKTFNEYKHWLVGLSRALYSVISRHHPVKLNGQNRRFAAQ